MEAYFVVKDSSDVEMIIFSHYVVTMKDGANNGTLLDMVNGASIFIPQPKAQVLQLMIDSYKKAMDKDVT